MTQVYRGAALLGDALDELSVEVGIDGALKLAKLGGC